MVSSAPVNLLLRPGITNPGLWWPERPARGQWNKIRKGVLERDSYTCQGCGHRALLHMNIHHLTESGQNNPDNLATLCVACHAVLHVGMNLKLGVVEIWKSGLSQVDIVRKTREGVKKGRSLAQIKRGLKLKRGRYSPRSIRYANDLVLSIGDESRAYLKEPLCAVFVKLKRWQLE